MHPTSAHAQSRKIIHIDMDCFYAAIEMRDQPTLVNTPVAVGGQADQRGVLCTCNYQARQYGLHSAMATREALKRCPNLVLLPVDMVKYKKVSKEIRAIFTRVTDQVEPLSLDEAYLDVSQCRQHQGSATLIARAIKAEITTQLQLTASAGVAQNKLLAKIASDWCKPNGLFVIRPDQVKSFMQTLPAHKLPGVGKVTRQKLSAQGINSCADLQGYSKTALIEKMGKFGKRLYDYCRGIDHRAVESHRIRKSLSVERTFQTDLLDIKQANHIIINLGNELQKRLQPYQNKPIKTHFVKIKFNNFQQTTIEAASKDLDITLFNQLMIKGYHRSKRPMRLIGIGVKFEVKSMSNQRQLAFDW